MSAGELHTECSYTVNNNEAVIDVTHCRPINTFNYQAWNSRVLDSTPKWNGIECNWLTVTRAHSYLMVVATDHFPDSNTVSTFQVSYLCIYGMCNCVHRVSSCHVQFKPCRVFRECFFRGETDPDWEFIPHRSIFGIGK